MAICLAVMLVTSLVGKFVLTPLAPAGMDPDELHEKIEIVCSPLCLASCFG